MCRLGLLYFTLPLSICGDLRRYILEQDYKICKKKNQIRKIIKLIIAFFDLSFEKKKKIVKQKQRHFRTI